MTTNLSELCTLAVDDLYGELCSRVFSVLALKGRLSFPALLHYSELPARHVRHGLVVLIQQNLVQHHKEVYEANLQAAYTIVRYGKIVKMVEIRFGEKAGGLVSNLLLLGHARVDDLADAYGVKNAKRNNRVNGDAHLHGSEAVDADGAASGAPKHNHVKSLNDLHDLLRQLLRSGYIEPVRKYQFQPDQDFTNDAEEFIRKVQPPTSKGQKEMDKFNLAVRDLKRKWREVDDRNGESNADSTTERSYKKQHVMGNGANGYNYNGLGAGANFLEIDDKLVVRVNLEKCNVGLRTHQLVELAERFIGGPTALVYEALLIKMEEKVDKCFQTLEEGIKDEDAPVIKLPSVTTMDVAFAIDPNIDLNGSIWLGGDSGFNGDADDDAVAAAESNVDRRTLVERHIRLLVEDPRRFASWVGNRGGGEWTVDFRAVGDTLIQYEVENATTARFGRYATRLIRLLHKKGKLDEKQLASHGLLKQKGIRSILNTMHEAGYIEVQEVPKDLSRQPSRTLYLWFYEQDRVQRLILSETYKAMARIHQRIKVERAKVQAVIDKAERTDVIGHEEEYLSAMERRVLRNWSEKEEKLLGQLSRQDNLAAVLRDFNGLYSRDIDPVAGGVEKEEDEDD